MTLMKLIFSTLINFCRLFVPINSRKILFHSFPDFSDNSFAFFIYIINNDQSYKNIWLVDNYEKKKDFEMLISKYTSSKNFLIVKKKSLKGIKEFLSSKYIFHTHGLFNEVKLSSKQINVNLWHGMPLKKIGYLDNNTRIPKSDFLIATSHLFSDVLVKAFDTEKKRVLVTGLPRNDFLFETKHCLIDLVPPVKNDFEKTVLWMPTYRKSVIGDIRTDGASEKSKDFLEDSSLSYLNGYLKTIKTACFIKLHPMDFMKVEDFKAYSNIYFINDEIIGKSGVTMYSLLNSVDLMLTDFSSIYVDFLLLNKPIGFVFSDFDEYLNSRGFVFESPLNCMPGRIINNNDELKSFIMDIFVKGKDNYKQKREEITEIFHDVKNNFSVKLFEQIFRDVKKT